MRPWLIALLVIVAAGVAFVGLSFAREGNFVSEGQSISLLQGSIQRPPGSLWQTACA